MRNYVVAIRSTEVWYTCMLWPKCQLVLVVVSHYHTKRVCLLNNVKFLTFDPSHPSKVLSCETKEDERWRHFQKTREHQTEAPALNQYVCC